LLLLLDGVGAIGVAAAAVLTAALRSTRSGTVIAEPNAETVGRNELRRKTDGLTRTN
jgi:hypothetical protein